MSAVFLQVLNMSLTASYVILFILAVRLLLKKAPKIFSYALWGIVLFRLICPFSFEGLFSLLLINPEPIPSNITYAEVPQINTGIELFDSAVNPILSAQTTAQGASVNPMQIWVSIGKWAWFAGIAVLLIYSIISLFRLRSKLVGAVKWRDNIYLADHIASPFVMGLLRPKIYLPSTLSEQEQEYIILHEQTHIKRLDHIVKIVAFLVLAVHWFNPLVWMAFFLCVKDMEMSCDEAVMKRIDTDIRRQYSASLLSLATGRKIVAGIPLAFGEGDTKSRIRNVLNYKKPTFWIVIALVIACIAVAVLLLANPAKPLELPEAASVLSMDLEQFNEYETLGVVTITDSSNIETVLSALSGARKTLRQSVNDYPVQNNYLIVRLILAGERRTLCLYAEENAYYIEEPYVGIYRSDRNASVAIYKIYTGSGGINDLSEQILEAEGTPESANNSVFDRVKITFTSGINGSKSADEFETTASKIVAYIYSTIRNMQPTEKVVDLNKNYINQYTIQLSNNIGGSSYGLYYDTLYNKAYIVGDGGLSETNTNFARYVDSLLENTDIKITIDDTDAAALFNKYGWTLDYQISAMNNKLNNITVLTGFNPNAYYFAYNNVLSTDIGLDMSGYSNSANIDVEIYRINESMPQEFYPIQNCRGIVVKENGKIIGAFISAGRHSAFNASSLKGNSFEKVAGQTLDEWLAERVQGDTTDEKLSKLEPEQIIKEYFTALNEKDAQTAKGCISKKTLLGNLTSNMPNDELFNEGYSLLLTDSDFSNLKSAKLIEAKLINEPDKNTKTFRITVDLQYDKVISIGSGEQPWDCIMVYESPQTGWKIEGFGH
jgi:beta-lactamase regulating signal transducer with metallopeptidase domain